MKVVGYVLLVIGAASVAMATPAVPEVDGVTAGSAICLFSGVLVLMKSRRGK